MKKVIRKVEKTGVKGNRPYVKLGPTANVCLTGLFPGEYNILTACKTTA